MDYKKKYLLYKNKYSTLKKQQGGGPLHDAIREENIEKVRGLLNSGADINQISDIDGYSPLQISIIKVNIPIFNLLIERGANFNFINSSGDSCLKLAYVNCKKNFSYVYDILYSLFHRGIIIDDNAIRIIKNKHEKLFFKYDILDCLEKIDQSKIGNIEYFKTEPFMIDSVKIWVNYLPDAAFAQLLLWAKPSVSQISTLLGRSSDETKPIDSQENREKVATEGLMSYNIIDFISPKKKYYDELVRLRL